MVDLFIIIIIYVAVDVCMHIHLQGSYYLNRMEAELATHYSHKSIHWLVSQKRVAGLTRHKIMHGV